MDKIAKLKASDHEDYAKYTILALVIPVVGIIMGIIYATKDDKLEKKLGEHMIAMSLLFGLLWTVVWLFLFDMPAFDSPTAEPVYY